MSSCVLRGCVNCRNSSNELAIIGIIVMNSELRASKHQRLA